MSLASEKARASKSRNQLYLASSPLLEEESRGLLRLSLQAPLPTPPSLKDAWLVFYIFLKFLDDVPEYGLFSSYICWKLSGHFYLFLAELGLCSCVGFYSSGGEQGRL